jgi:hypothetical protein
MQKKLSTLLYFTEWSGTNSEYNITRAMVCQTNQVSQSMNSYNVRIYMYEFIQVFSAALSVTRYPMTYTHEKQERKAVCLHLYLSPIPGCNMRLPTH